MKISVKVLADFMLAGDARRRAIIRDSKYPRLKDGKPKPQIVRYGEVRSAIREYHRSGNDINVLITEIEKLTKRKAEHPEKDASRIDDNIRAIKAYMAHFSKNEFSVLTTPKPIYQFGEVKVSATPDLCVEENGAKKLIKLDFNQQKPKAGSIEIILKVMYEAAFTGQLGVRPRDVVYLDVSRQEHYNGAKLNEKLKKDVDAALATIQDMWTNIRQAE
jgi:hypothetical protein